MRNVSAVRVVAVVAALAAVLAPFAEARLPQQPAVSLAARAGASRGDVPLVQERATQISGGALRVKTKPAPGTMSSTVSIFSLTKNIVGAGMLALPAGMAANVGTGLVPSVMLIFGSCFLSAYTFILVSRVVEATGAEDFREAWSLTLNESSAGMVDFMIMGVAGSALLVYGCFLGDLFSSLSGGLLSRTQAIGATSAVLMPLCLMPDLSALAPSSYVGIAAVLYSAFFVVKRCLDGTYAAGGAFADAVPFAADLSNMSLSRISLGTCILFNMLLTAFMAHTNAVRFYNELEGRTPAKFSGVSNSAFLVSAVLYSVVMLAGYRTFGSASQGLVLNNYATSDGLAKLARLATGVSILGSYPLLFTSFRDVVVSTLRASGIKAVSKFGASAGIASSFNWRFLSVFTLIAISLLAVVTTDVGFVVSVAGSSFGAALIFCVPALLFLAAKKGDTNNLLPASKAEIGGAHLLFAFGVAAAVFGTTVTCLDTFTDLLG